MNPTTRAAAYPFYSIQRQAIKPKKMRQQFFGLCDRRFGKEKQNPNRRIDREIYFPVREAGKLVSPP